MNSARLVSSPRSPGSPRASESWRSVRGGLVLLCIVAIFCASHVFLSSLGSAKTTDGAIDADQIATLKERVDNLENRMERHAKNQDLKVLRERVFAVEETEQSLRVSENNIYSGAYGSKNETFCVPWERKMDEWWTHHVDWQVSFENKTHYCFSPMDDPKGKVFRKLYDIQFHGNCSNVITKKMWSSGFGADFKNIVHDMGGHWHYAAKKDGSRPVCDKKNMYCYFLNMSRCEPVPERAFEGDFLTENYEPDTGLGRWFMEYATRPQTWLRHQVFLFSEKVTMITPCTVMHVRRSDIVLHGKSSRRYREIDECMNAISDKTKNILLLTDDDNAISEAKTKFPEYNWMYIDRPRHRGAEGGWENQIPSDDPKLEVIVLLSIFRLVRQCSSLIHTYSNLAHLIRKEMEEANADVNVVNLDLQVPQGTIHSINNTLSVNISKSYT